MDLLEKYTEEKKLYDEIVAKCWRDENFKTRLVNNPTVTIEEYTGKKYNHPENKRLKVEDQTSENLIYLNIPKKPKSDNIELSEDELEMVAGGVVWWPYVAITAAIYDFAQGVADGGMGR